MHMQLAHFRLSSSKCLLIAVALTFLLALVGAPGLSAKLQFNLDALCIAHDVDPWQPQANCSFQLDNYLLQGSLGPAAARLATALALNPNYNALAHAVIRLPLSRQDVDQITATRLLLLRFVLGEHLLDLAAWRGAASSNMLEGTAAYLQRQNDPQDAETAKVLAFALDSGWYDNWQRGNNARDRGITALEAGHLMEAQTAYERAIASFALVDLPTAREYTAYAYFRLAQVAEQSGEVERALEYYRKGIWSSPQHCDFSLPVKLILATGGSMNDVYEYLAGVRRDGPQDNPTLWSYSADILASMGARDMALRVLAETPPALLDSPLIRGIKAKLTNSNDG
jgi:tetratricopeptide (TPR) repeat protein